MVDRSFGKRKIAHNTANRKKGARKSTTKVGTSDEEKIMWTGVIFACKQIQNRVTNRALATQRFPPAKSRY
jgi:hypothetical protein